MENSWVEQLLDCQCRDDITDTVNRYLPGHGFDYWLYAIRVPLSATRKQHYAVHTFPDSWWEMCKKHYGQNIDPIAEHCKQYITPVAWLSDDHSQFIDQLTPEGIRVIQQTGRVGVTGGIAVPLRDSGINWGSVMIGLKQKWHIEVLKNDIPFALHFAIYLHQAFCRIGHDCKENPAPNLTAREVECLSWAAEGKTSREISQLLGISERTVVFHLQNASGKLGVFTRQQAIAHSIMLGIVSP
ncbi:MAG: LuxR C-terminal-related transcriptional regulator [Herbaspirillum sp.]